MLDLDHHAGPKFPRSIHHGPRRTHLRQKSRHPPATLSQNQALTGCSAHAIIGIDIWEHAPIVLSERDLELEEAQMKCFVNAQNPAAEVRGEGLARPWDEGVY